MKDNIKNFYERYHKNTIYNPIADFMQNQRCTYLRYLMMDAYGRVLVIGCGSQNEMSIINEKCEGIGIDISQTAVEITEKKSPIYKYFVADATKLPFSNDVFDCVVCSEVIEHIPEDEKALSEIRRILKNDGIFIITTSNWINWYGIARKIAEKLLGKPFTAGNQPVDNWSTPYSLRKKLVKYGFEITLFRGLWYYPPTGRGKKQIPSDLTFPLIKLFYPFELLFRRFFPWFGHIIIFKTRIVKNEK